MIFWRSDDSYSAFVSWAKVGLYVGALALLSTLFLFSGRVQVTDAIIYSDLDVDELVRQQRISAPYFTTQTEDGVDVAISASYAENLPEDGGLAANEILASLTDPNSETVQINAAEGRIDPNFNTASFQGTVEIVESGGLTLLANNATVDLEQAEFKTNDPVSATGPFGSFTAGAVTGRRTAEGYQFTFTGGVKVVYTPPTSQ